MQIVDQFGQGGHLGLQRTERRRRRLPHAVLQRLQLAAQHRQRRAQLVRDVGHKSAAHLFVFLQRGGQLVEVVRQPAQFILAADRHAGGEIARRQAMGARHQALDRGQHAARQ